MAPDDLNHEHEGGGQPHLHQEPSPPPLTDEARATIYLDGLIYLAYNQNQKMLESAVLTHEAGNHRVEITVKLRGSQQLLFPNDQQPWAMEHTKVKEAAPFWLYVDSGNRLKTEFSADLHKGDRGFDQIFDFEERHRKPLAVTPGTFAQFNFPHGTSYSAEKADALLKFIPPNKTLEEAKDLKKIPIAGQVGIDITAASNGAGKKWIVLANQDGQHEFFRFELEPDKQYEIRIENRPVPGTSAHSGPKDHFLKFYNLFGLDHATEPQFVLVDPAHAQGGNTTAPASEEVAHPPSPDNPPCAIGKGSGGGGLSGGGGG